MARARKTTCRHAPTGTVSWPLDMDAIRRGAAHASVYSCSREDCIRDASRWVHDHTGMPGVYRAFRVSFPSSVGGES